MRKFLSHHRDFWNSDRRRSLYVGLFLLGVSLLLHVQAGRYSAKSAALSNFVGDLFLDNIPPLDIDFLVVQGALLFWAAVVVLLAARPQSLLFGVKAIALFVIFRSFFVSLTHIGVYPEQIPLDDGIGVRLYDLFTFQGNFFFSGHTGLPFLLALVFWRERPWRLFFLASALMFGIAVLLAHIHYSIDVFSAPFITYSIFAICRKLFPRDYALAEAARPL
ncbi:MAG: hypothetical protein HYY10_02215 [Candidatus Liptonbacteria bacterium]|nr:hypothetical protein [Candidatus Liptonbacteria bacterium]